MPSPQPSASDPLLQRQASPVRTLRPASCRSNNPSVVCHSSAGSGDNTYSIPAAIFAESQTKWRQKPLPKQGNYGGSLHQFMLRTSQRRSKDQSQPELNG